MNSSKVSWESLSRCDVFTTTSQRPVLLNYFVRTLRCSNVTSSTFAGVDFSFLQLFWLSSTSLCSRSFRRCWRPAWSVRKWKDGSKPRREWTSAVWKFKHVWDMHRAIQPINSIIRRCTDMEWDERYKAKSHKIKLVRWKKRRLAKSKWQIVVERKSPGISGPPTAEQNLQKKLQPLEDGLRVQNP